MGQQTRWERAKKDWPRWQWRDLLVGVLGIALAVLVLLALGRPGEAVEEVLIAGGAGVAAVILYPLAQLLWAWLQAPMRILTEEVVAIGRAVDGLPRAPLPPPEPEFDMRYSLLNSIRLGQVLRDRARRGGMTNKDWEDWVAPVVAMLTAHAEREDVEAFLARRSLVDQINALEVMLGRYQ